MSSVMTVFRSFLPFTLLAFASGQDPELLRIDCYPEAAGGVDLVDQEKCEERGCTWQVAAIESAPWCFVPQTDDWGYDVIDGPIPTEYGDQWILQRKNEQGIYGENIEFLTFDVEYRRDNLLRFTVGMTYLCLPVERCLICTNPFEISRLYLFDKSFRIVTFMSNREHLPPHSRKMNRRFHSEAKLPVL